MKKLVYYVLFVSLLFGCSVVYADCCDSLNYSTVYSVNNFPCKSDKILITFSDYNNNTMIVDLRKEVTKDQIMKIEGINGVETVYINYKYKILIDKGDLFSFCRDGIINKVCKILE